MRIGLLSDTHVPDAISVIPGEVLEAFKGVDLILHAGDIYDRSVLDKLEQVAPVLAARGDDDYLCDFNDKRVREKHVLEVEGMTLWLIHDRSYYLMGSLWKNRMPGGQNEDAIPDVIIFGHEHRALVNRNDDILFINPGSPTFLNYRRGLGTIGILEINSSLADIKILQI